jgi:L-lysine exporter family protein LysE/ArgO
MVTALIVGIVVGYVLAIPPGPIGMAAIRMGIRDGWRPSIKLAMGAGVFDVLYCALAMMATSAIVDALTNLAHSTPLATIGIQLLIVVVMILFGLIQMREKPASKTGHREIQPSSFIEWVKGHGPFFVGVGFAIANLANPTFVPALAGMATFIQQLEWFESSLVNILFFALGFGAGNMLWMLTLVHLVVSNRDKMTPTFVKRIQQVSGFTLIGFGTFYGLRIITMTKWADVLRIIFAA